MVKVEFWISDEIVGLLDAFVAANPPWGQDTIATVAIAQFLMQESGSVERSKLSQVYLNAIASVELAKP